MVCNDESLNAAYAGEPLRPTTRYQWTVTIWDAKGRTSSAQRWFETGLLNPDPKLTAWSGATWIGGSDAELVLRADYLSVYDLSFSIAIAPGSDRGAIVFAANEPRLMNRNRNIFGSENERDASYFKVELDIGPLSSNSRDPARSSTIM